LDEGLRKQVPPVFVAATLLLLIMSLVAVVTHYSMGHFSNYSGITLLQEQLVDVASSTRGMRLQGLAAKEEKAKEEEEEAIRFESDRKVGGGDLMVPVSMVDYENLGEGSIVDQVDPRPTMLLSCSICVGACTIHTYFDARRGACVK